MAPGELQLLGYCYSSMITNAGRQPNRAMDGDTSRAALRAPTTGCATPSYQVNGQISYADAVHVYLLTFVCANLQEQSDGSYLTVQAGWYYSTATSLETQDWTTPQLMPNSLKPVTTDRSGGGRYFDGWYPSFMSPGCRAGHLALSDNAFFLNGNSIGVAHQLNSRAFNIDVDGDTRSADAGCSGDDERDNPVKVEDTR